jgi:hypothetical protein
MANLWRDIAVVTQPVRSHGMDGVLAFLNELQKHGLPGDNLLGLLHVLIGRRITLSDGTVISTGLTWRDTAGALKRVRFNPQSVRHLGLNPDELPPRDRQRFWYAAITQAHVDSPAAVEAGDRLAALVQPLGYVIGPAPGRKA